MNFFGSFQGFGDSNAGWFDLIKVSFYPAVHHNFRGEICHDDDSSSGCRRIFYCMCMGNRVTDGHDHDVRIFHGGGHGCRRFFSGPFARLHTHNHYFCTSVTGNGSNSLSDVCFSIVSDQKDSFPGLHFCSNID